MRQVQPVVHRVAEVLTRAAANTDGATVSLAGWSALDTNVGLKVGSVLGLLPFLHVRLQQGQLELNAPVFAEWPDVLAQQHELTAQRNRRLLEYTGRIFAQAEAMCLKTMPLKGMDVLTQLYDDIGLRPTSDIDLLAHPEDLEAASQVIQRAGFQSVAATRRHAIFALPNSRVVSKFGEHPDNPIKVELHAHVSNAMPMEACDLTETLWRDAQANARPNMPTAMYSSRVGLMLHEMLHAANHAMIRSLRFPSLYDMRLLAERLSAAEWQAIADTLRTSEHYWWAYVPLRLLVRYFGSVVPADILALSCRIATPALRKLGDTQSLSQVSVCDLRPSVLRHRLAFARNVPETLRYLRSQALPTHDELNEWRVERSQWSATMTPANSYLHRIRRWLDPNMSRIEM